MLESELTEFAELLVKKVRDATIRNCDGLLRPNAMSPAAKRWRQAVSNPELLSIVISDVVDETVFSFLHEIDAGSLRLNFVSRDGKETNLADAGRGELAGWYMGSQGWRARFSSERYIDDFADLANS